MTRLLCILLLFCLAAPQIGHAQTASTQQSSPAPTSSQTLVREVLRASLQTAWEQNVMKDPDTKLFEKSNDPNIYYVQTDLIPYKGRVKIVNLLIRPYTPTAEYDKKVAYSGVVETELLDPAPNLPSKDSVSAKEWGKLSWFNYDKSKDEWFPTSTWQARFPNARHVKIETPMSISNDSIPSFMDVVIMVAEIVFGVFFVVLLGGAGVYGHRQQKLRLAMDEHTQLLREILAVLKEK